jgi:predicted Zn finger-like uncharacterized protein
MSIATTCPHCRAVYNLADHLRDHTVRCKKCQGAIVVGKGATPRSQEKAKVPAAGKRPPRREHEKSSRRKRGGSRLLPIGLILGGAALLLLGGGVLAFLLLSGRLGNRAPDMLVNVSGPWPEPMDFPPIMGNVDRSPAVVIRIANALDEETRQEVGERLGYLADNGFPASTGASKDDRTAIRMSPVKDPKAFADKIDFATVRGVSGRTITIVARKPDGPMSDPDDVTKALYRLKLPYLAAHKKAAILLKGKNLDERRAELLRTPDPRQAEVLRGLESALNDADRYTREEIYHALGVWGTKETVPVLLKEMQKEETRGSVIQALGRIKEPSACEQIAPCLVPISTRWNASEALKAIGPSGEPFALKYLNHDDQQVRIMVCQLLGKIGGPRSIAELEKLLDDKDGAVALFAKGALETINKRR